MIFVEVSFASKTSCSIDNDFFLNVDATLKVRYKYSVSRKTYNEKMLGTISMEPFFVIEEADQDVRNALISMLTAKNISDRMQLPYLFPKFLKVNDLYFHSRLSFECQFLLVDSFHRSKTLAVS